MEKLPRIHHRAMEWESLGSKIYGPVKQKALFRFLGLLRRGREQFCNATKQQCRPR
jgi:hypothetical protein